MLAGRRLVKFQSIDSYKFKKAGQKNKPFQWRFPIFLVQAIIFLLIKKEETRTELGFVHIIVI